MAVAIGLLTAFVVLAGGAADGAVGLSTLSLYQTTNAFCFMFSKVAN